ncbi:MAG: Hpt domain-containing protein [Cypionkella sp.]|uniref:Hpt domain-containing protein n=1 Tax=Cypionkella sp. TaxID=2811411 RepID=UPI002ABB6488|nr:Hpt domain-containing protein [Cypionkella sp.]MDZ4311820.1 Hpt domain-containing protein [Cypionkella sp.]MDZ4393364.1 Hpt domain-containing protein [Cypionkella sp.]
MNELRSEIGEDDFAEVVAMFLEEADEVIARLSRTVGAKALEADLHFLKGAALNLGFARFAAACQSGERRAAAGDTAVDVAQVCSSYQASKQALVAGPKASAA